jgi:hypothetical protein
MHTTQNGEWALGAEEGAWVQSVETYQRGEPTRIASLPTLAVPGAMSVVWSPC